MVNNSVKRATRTVEVRRVYNPLQGDYSLGTIELDIVERGKLRVHYGSGQVILRSGQWLLAKADETLALSREGGGAPLSVIQVRMSEALFPDVLVALPECASLDILLKQSARGAYSSDPVPLRELRHRVEQVHDAHGLGVIRSVWRLMSLLAETPACSVVSPLPDTSLGKVPPESDMARVVTYMKAHLAETVRLSDLARVAHLTPSAFCRSFARQAGQPPMAYLDTLRLRKACHLLDYTGLTAKEISYQCGWQDASFFSRVFRRHIGMTPIQYRQRKG
ncbi:MAG: AraC family transcriptional regulator [Prevotellaceae bacterium]|nr:AraC family transcriptional regulator [Prevotellaceae bacterium]MDY3855751.1 AraC family transcriptional regulator [Bacteroidaceae bacterium]